MNSSQLRDAFFDFFASKQHQIVPSAPMVIKNDPTLMFTNAGMNQFKDIFLGNTPARHRRIANTQKCLRVSGKHNDLEEVGHDTYHHTMFEMLGNWSFGDYFKKEAITWGMEFLADVLKIPEDRLYATIFEGSPAENLERDEEAYRHWLDVMDRDRIMAGSKKDNFWEMGDTGPCGPCSEIHVDLRSDEERKSLPGRELINRNHPQVIEIWNLVFIQYNRRSGGKLELLPAKHVDTGMGFERLCMIVQDKKSNYDTDLFQPLIREIAGMTANVYGTSEETDTAMRVVADHLRAIAFSIADGQLPSNSKAGYVIRRILRRAIRYGFTFLQQTDPFIHRFVPILADTMGDAFPELRDQKDLIMRVICEEESAFLKTLESGIRLLDEVIEKSQAARADQISGKTAFVLYDTYGFPLDLTELILLEKGLTVNRDGFEMEMKLQKERSRNASSAETDDWIILRDEIADEFTGYHSTESDVHITRYRKARAKGEERYHLVFNRTPFYAESGGQIGDSGYIESGQEKIEILDTLKENNLTLHITGQLPSEPEGKFRAVVDAAKREMTAGNHTATHLLHYALRNILGNHVEQKGSLVSPDYLRFDFSHYQKVTDEEIIRIEAGVNGLIRANLSRDEHDRITMDKAAGMGAMALFGEKYGDLVRVIRFGNSVELCGGIHVEATGQIGFFKIISEGAIAAGIRRIEALTGNKALEYANTQIAMLREIARVVKGSEDPVRGVKNLVKQNREMSSMVESMQKEGLRRLRKELAGKVKKVKGMNLVAEEIRIHSPEALKDLCFQLRTDLPDLVLIVGAEIEGKASLAIMISEDMVNKRHLDASKIIKMVAGEIRGGGGGQPFFATAGGKDPSGISRAIRQARQIISGS